jgi:hypothetical protein
VLPHGSLLLTETEGCNHYSWYLRIAAPYRGLPRCFPAYHIDDHAPVSTSHSTLRQFAGLCLLIFGALAGWEYLGRNHQRVPLLFAGLAADSAMGGRLGRAVSSPSS